MLYPTNLEIRGVLVRARELLTSKGWTREWWAKDSKGCPRNPLDSDACSFCVMGAIAAAAPDTARSRPIDQWDNSLHPDFGPLGLAAIEALEDNAPVMLADFNDDDSTKLRDVLDLFDRTIAEL